MAKKTPIKTAKHVMSGKTTAQRIKAMDKAMTPAMKKKAKAKAKTMPAYKPATKHVKAREDRIKAQRAADRKAIAAKRKGK